MILVGDLPRDLLDGYMEGRYIGLMISLEWIRI
jgi:hypothetical protein